MTGEQLKQLIADAISGDDWANRGPDGDADAVLRAIRAAGIVMGERANYDDASDDVFDGDLDNWDGLMAEYAKTGLALVRVVE